MNRFFKPLFESLIEGAGDPARRRPSLGHPRQPRPALSPRAARLARNRRGLYRRRLGLRRTRRAVPARAVRRYAEKTADPRRARLQSLQSRLMNLQTRRRSRAVAEEHYDIDHRMYALFLGPWNQYTCCFFDGHERPRARRGDQARDALRQARAARRAMRLLDIGCGWGGFAKYAASTRGCEVTGISLSDEQIRYANEYTRGLAGHDPQARLPRPAGFRPRTLRQASRSSA